MELWMWLLIGAAIWLVGACCFETHAWYIKNYQKWRWARRQNDPGFTEAMSIIKGRGFDITVDHREETECQPEEILITFKDKFGTWTQETRFQADR